MEARRGFFKTKKANGATPEKKKSEMGSDPRCYRDKRWPLHREKGGQILCSVVSGLRSKGEVQGLCDGDDGLCFVTPQKRVCLRCNHA